MSVKRHGFHIPPARACFRCFIAVGPLAAGFPAAGASIRAPVPPAKFPIDPFPRFTGSRAKWYNKMVEYELSLLGGEF